MSKIGTFANIFEGGANSPEKGPNEADYVKKGDFLQGSLNGGRNNSKMGLLEGGGRDE